MTMRKSRALKQDYEAFKEENEYYTVQKILEMKQQGGKVYYLVKWLNWDVKTCTWEEQANVQHLKSLIKQFHNSRRHDHHKNHGLKQLDYVESGMSPYQATNFYGHPLYGDEPKQIKRVQIIEKNNEKQLHFQVEWFPRPGGFKPSNSLLQGKTLEEHEAQFLAKFLQTKTKLIPKNKKND